MLSGEATNTNLKVCPDLGSNPRSTALEASTLTITPPMWSSFCLRDRPFNLKGGLMVFCFVQNYFFRTTQELEFFFLSRKVRNFFQEFNIRLYDKNSESDYFFFLHQNQNIFFSNIGNQNIFLEKNHNPPVEVKLSFP